MEIILAVCLGITLSATSGFRLFIPPLVTRKSIPLVTDTVDERNQRELVQHNRLQVVGTQYNLDCGTVEIAF